MPRKVCAKTLRRIKRLASLECVLDWAGENYPGTMRARHSFLCRRGTGRRVQPGLLPIEEPVEQCRLWPACLCTRWGATVECDDCSDLNRAPTQRPPTLPGRTYHEGH